VFDLNSSTAFPPTCASRQYPQKVQEEGPPDGRFFAYFCQPGHATRDRAL
jgi:hypothetical protein